MDKPIYFSKIEFKNNFIKDCEGTMLLNLVEKELSYQLVRRYQKDERILFSYGVKIKDDDLPELLQYCNAFDFEPYRNIDESMEFKGSGGYRDSWGIVFRGISDSYLPMLKINMVMYHDEKHISPSEKLYKYLIQKYFGHKKFKKYGIYY